MSSTNWKSFFLAAGIQPSVADDYVLMFNKNRMRFDMIEDLTTDILKQMGIYAMGDVIAIIKQSEKVVKERACSRLYKTPISSTTANGISGNRSLYESKVSASKSIVNNNSQKIQTQDTATVRQNKLTSAQAASLKKMFTPMNTVAFKATEKRQQAGQSNKITTTVLNRLGKTQSSRRITAPSSSIVEIKSHLSNVSKPSTVHSRLSFDKNRNFVNNNKNNRNFKKDIKSRLGFRKESVFSRLGETNDSIFRRLGN